MRISVIIPIYNEEENIKILFDELFSVLFEMEKYEVIFVDDGSSDNTCQVIKDIIKDNPEFKLITLRKNFGQTAAISAGIDIALGDVIILMDGDLQNDPKDIPTLLEKMSGGYDVVSGWRKKRQDKLFTRKLPSFLANRLISFITGVRLHDYGCTLKAYRKEVIKGVRLYGEMHRFIPAYTAWYGAKITEVVVNHRPRKFGKTKYGLSRTFRVVLDLIVVKFLSKYMTRPIHFFGGVGFFLLGFGFLSGLFAVYLKIFQDISFVETPLLLFSSFLAIVGMLLILMGVLAEILIRIYYEFGKNQTYVIKEIYTTKEIDAKKEKDCINL